MASLRNANTGKVVAGNVMRAIHWRQRLIGLLPKGHIGPDEGIWFDNCAAVHTVGMRVPIDIIFLDDASRVMRIARSVRSMRFAVACRGAATVIELGEGAGVGRGVLVGDRLLLE